MFDVFSIKAYDAEGKIAGHLPMEKSRIIKFLMDRGGRLTATLRTTFTVDPLSCRVASRSHVSSKHT